MSAVSRQAAFKFKLLSNYWLLASAANVRILWCACRQSNRLAANRHNSTDPDVTPVAIILIRLPTAVETTEIGRSVARNDFDVRFFFFFAATGIVCTENLNTGVVLVKSAQDGA
jgi:hypothetical protein